MRKAEWTYEVPPAGSDAAGLEDYQVESSVGEPLGKVKAVLRRGEDLFVAVESGAPPLARRVRAVPWTEIADVDHDSLTLRVNARADELHRYEVLDSGQAVEDGDAEAVRVTDVPGAPQTVDPVAAETPGAVDRPSYLWGLIVSLLGVFSALLTIVVVSVTDEPWRFGLFVIPGVLLALGGSLMYRWLRRPSEHL